MIENIKELRKYRQLFYMIVWRDIRVKYKQSVMGFLWAIFMPLIIISAGVLVRFAMATLSGNELTLEDIASVSVKSLPWAFFISSIRFGSSSLIGNTNLVTKVYFPKEIFPISAVISQLFDFLIASSVLLVILCIAQIGVSAYLLWIPVILVLLVLLCMGLSLLLSTANLFFRDVKYIIEVILTFGIFFTPVFYEVSRFAEKDQRANLLLLNPVAPLLESIKDCVVLQQAPPGAWLIYSACFALVCFIVSYLFFKKMEPAFAESI